MALPKDAADSLTAWKQENFGWITPAENRVLVRLIERLRGWDLDDSDMAKLRG